MGSIITDVTVVNYRSTKFNKSFCTDLGNSTDI